MKINGNQVTTRHERPTVLGPTALLLYFINDGQYVDPQAISGVSIFAASDNQSPSSVISPDGEIKPDASSNVLMHFSNQDANTNSSDFDPSNYNAGDSDANGIYKLDIGKFACVLDKRVTTGIFNLSGEATINNRVSSTGDYIDVWTVQRVSDNVDPDGGSDLDTIINEFTLTEDRFFGVTEPLLFRVATRLENNHVVLGSKVDLKFTNEFTLENANIDRSIVNLFKMSLVTDPMIEIYKKNQDRNLGSRIEVSGYSDTSGLIDTTSENTVIFTLDTEALKTHPELLNGNLGSLTGTYVARLKFNALNQTIVSNDMAFIIR
tara:strand:- start:528 stop:1490 length:963 start_codon:yes stop_codon:yes gene_type:complete